MPWDRKRLLGYVETIQLIIGVTDKSFLQMYVFYIWQTSNVTLYHA